MKYIFVIVMNISYVSNFQVRGNGKKYNEVFVHVFARRNYAVEPGSFGKHLS